MLLDTVVVGKVILWGATCCRGAQKFTSLRVQWQVNLLDGRRDLLLFCALCDSAGVVGVGVEGNRHCAQLCRALSVSHLSICISSPGGSC